MFSYHLHTIVTKKSDVLTADVLIAATYYENICEQLWIEWSTIIYHKFKVVCSHNILILQGSTGSITFLGVKWKPIFWMSKLRKAYIFGMNTARRKIWYLIHM